jgi:hypothetical protein
MAIDGGQSTLGALDALHPIHGHHEVLRKEGYVPGKSSSYRLNKNTPKEVKIRSNYYTAPNTEKPDVYITTERKKDSVPKIEHEAVYLAQHSKGYRLNPNNSIWRGINGKTPESLERHISKLEGKTEAEIKGWK